MAGENGEVSGPDLSQEGVAQSDLADGGMMLGHVDDNPVLLVRSGKSIYAIDATCSHYGGPLAEGLFDGTCVRCPWHHARFDVGTGKAAAPPALNDIPAYSVEVRDGRWYVLSKTQGTTSHPPLDAWPASVVIVGAGAAGNAAAETLRHEGYSGSVTLIGAETSVPPVRPNLSKDYLAGTAPEEWVALRDDDFYFAQRIDLRSGRSVSAIDPEAEQITLDNGDRLPYGALLLATGAEPVRLDLPGAGREHVFTLRSLADSRAIIERAGQARRAVVLGASFIGLEVAAALRQRDLEVHIVAPEAIPLERILGQALGEFVRAIHEEHGVIFHLEHTAKEIGDTSVTLNDGSTIDADLIVIGVGVRPRVELAQAAGLTVNNGVVVDKCLRTSAAGIWAAGDIARWPDPRSGESIRVEHWAVAERQGQAAARNILGRNTPYADVPFFWSQHYDVPINYVGWAGDWDEAVVRGDAMARDVLVALRKGGKTLALASIYRDLESLQAEYAMERGDEETLAKLVG